MAVLLGFQGSARLFYWDDQVLEAGIHAWQLTLQYDAQPVLVNRPASTSPLALPYDSSWVPNLRYPFLSAGVCLLDVAAHYDDEVAPFQGVRDQALLGKCLCELYLVDVNKIPEDDLDLVTDTPLIECEGRVTDLQVQDSVRGAVSFRLRIAVHELSLRLNKKKFSP